MALPLVDAAVAVASWTAQLTILVVVVVGGGGGGGNDARTMLTLGRLSRWSSARVGRQQRRQQPK